MADRRFHAGGLVVLLGFIILAISFSVRASLSLLMPGWEVEFGWTRSEISAIAAVSLLVMAAVAPFIGRLADHAGAGPILAAGLLAIAAGLALMILSGPSFLPWLLPLGFAGVAAVGFGTIAQHVVAAVIAQNFDHRRGLATGIGTSGSTAGQLVLLPLIASFLQWGDWRQAFAALMMLCIVMAPLIFLAFRNQAASNPHAGAAKTASVTESLGFARLVREPAFQLIFWSYAICGFTTSGVIETHLMPFAAFCGFPPLPSAFAYGVLSAVNLAGMILAGWLSDFVNRPKLLAAIYVARALSFVLLLLAVGNYPVLILFAVLFGLFDYSTVPVTASFLASKFGVRSIGLSMGLLAAGHAVGGALGAWAGGAVFDGTGGYGMVWGGAVALSLGAAVLVMLLKDPRTASQG